MRLEKASCNQKAPGLIPALAIISMSLSKALMRIIRFICHQQAFPQQSKYSDNRKTFYRHEATHNEKHTFQELNINSNSKQLQEEGFHMLQKDILSSNNQFVGAAALPGNLTAGFYACWPLES